MVWCRGNDFCSLLLIYRPLNKVVLWSILMLHQTKLVVTLSNIGFWCWLVFLIWLQIQDWRSEIVQLRFCLIYWTGEAVNSHLPSGRKFSNKSCFPSLIACNALGKRFLNLLGMIGIIIATCIRCSCYASFSVPFTRYHNWLLDYLLFLFFRTMSFGKCTLVSSYAQFLNFWYVDFKLLCIEVKLCWKFIGFAFSNL